MSELPKGWVETLIEEIAELHRGVTYKKEDSSKLPFKDAIPILRANNIDDCINLNDLVYVPLSNVSENQIMQNNDILIAMSSGSKNLVGKSAQLLCTSKEYSFGAFCSVLRVGSLIHSSYVAYFLQSRLFRDLISEKSKGIGINNLKKDDVLNSRIILPPVAEQKRIVEKIEALFSRLDAGIAALEKTKALLKRYKISLVNKLFMPHIANESRKELNMVADVISGFAFKSSDFISDSIIPVIKIANVGYGNFEHKQQQFLPSSFLEEYSNFKIEANDILLALTRPITNNTLKICKYPKDEPVGLLNQRVAKIKPKPSILMDDYFIYFTNTEHFKSLVKDSFNETLQPNMSPKDLKLFKIPTPSIEIQLKTVTIIQKYYSTAEKSLEAIEQELKKAQALKSKILEYAFTGKLVPQNPEDEPAEKLLERIKAEKEASKPTKKTIKRK